MTKMVTFITVWSSWFYSIPTRCNQTEARRINSLVTYAMNVSIHDRYWKTGNITKMVTAWQRSIDLTQFFHQMIGHHIPTETIGKPQLPSVTWTVELEAEIHLARLAQLFFSWWYSVQKVLISLKRSKVIVSICDRNKAIFKDELKKLFMTVNQLFLGSIYMLTCVHARKFS